MLSVILETWQFLYCMLVTLRELNLCSVQSLNLRKKTAKRCTITRQLVIQVPVGTNG